MFPHVNLYVLQKSPLTTKMSDLETKEREEVETESLHFDKKKERKEEGRTITDNGNRLKR